MQEHIKLTTNVAVFPTVSALNESDRKILLAAGKAMLGAYAPYSEFRVGAAVLMENGTVVLGNNQENGAYPSGLCAERVAVFSARANFPSQRIKAIAIQASSENLEVTEPVAPCGACRQVLAEYERNQQMHIPILFTGESGPVYRLETVSELLPFLFHGDFLKKA